jgi:hypothetical protein
MSIGTSCWESCVTRGATTVATTNRLDATMSIRRLPLPTHSKHMARPVVLRRPYCQRCLVRIAPCRRTGSRPQTSHRHHCLQRARRQIHVRRRSRQHLRLQWAPYPHWRSQQLLLAIHYIERSRRARSPKSNHTNQTSNLDVVKKHPIGGGVSQTKRSRRREHRTFWECKRRYTFSSTSLNGQGKTLHNTVGFAYIWKKVFLLVNWFLFPMELFIDRRPILTSALASDLCHRSSHLRG